MIKVATLDHIVNLTVKTQLCEFSESVDFQTNIKMILPIKQHVCSVLCGNGINKFGFESKESETKSSIWTLKPPFIYAVAKN